MNTGFESFLSKYTTLSDDLISKIAEHTIVKNFKKGTILLKEGEQTRECYLVLKGCVRSYIIKDGEEKTIEFYTENEPISPLRFNGETSSEHYLECVEDTIATACTAEQEQKMFQQFPELESACRIVAEGLIENYKAALTLYRISTAEDRYKQLQKNRPDLIQRVPQYQLASYLGIKPESLSRIRKRLREK